MADIEENARRKAAGNKEITPSPIAIEVVHRIGELIEIELSIAGKTAQERLVVRRTLSRPSTRIFGSSGLYAGASRQALPGARPGQSSQLPS
jgi:hypothetical protein